ncbi:XrtA/PEP-CTERM system TPR-repeat protein PrsT [Simplicispira psychrophila]|uniref:XrtA/PEP-CTERM system TPR-repeat protein PrsT n=1 Tax=Simplicispira psychrophila TaxID=80882 RepID=UPI000484DAA5|nr:XrtA/PEP-CTERM system TPR-repeat protein PrsT [Simplicispira psychrophila]
MNTFAPRFLAPIATLAVALLASACGRSSPDELMASAETYLNRQDAPAAIIQLKNALQVSPDSARARFLLGQALQASGDVAGAETEYKKAQKLGYAPEEVIPPLANALLLQGNYSQLTTDYASQQLSSAPAQAALQTALAVAWQRQHQDDKFQTHIDAALQAQPDYAPALLALARARADAGHRDAALALLDKIPAQSPVEHEVLKLRGDMALLGQRDMEAALALYQQAVKVQPRYAQGHAAVVQLLLVQGKTESAAQALQALVKVAPGQATTLFWQAKLAYAKNDFKAVQEYTQKLLRLAPDNAYTLELAGMAELGLNNYVQAEALLAKALQLSPQLPLARRGIALTYARLGQFDKAIATLPPDLENSDSDSAMQSVAGQIYLLHGEVDRAQRYFSKAASLDPKNPLKRTSLAVSRLMGGQTEAGLEELQDIAASDDGVVADMALINALLQSGSIDRALDAITALEKKRPGDVLPYFLRGRALLLKNDKAGSRKAMERVLEIDPHYFPAIEILAQLDNADKRPGDARTRIEAAIQQQPANVQARLALVNLRAANGADKVELTSLLRKAVEAAPGDPTARLLLVEHLLRNNEPKDALIAAQQGVAAMPDNVLLLDGLGRAQWTSGEHNQAQSTFSRMAALQPQSPQPYLRMASAYLADGKQEAASQSLRKALEIKPDLLQAQQGLISLAMAAHKPAEALSISRTVQKQRPKEMAGYMLEGDIYAAGKAWDKVVEVSRAGLKQVSSPELAIRLHVALGAAGKKAEADQWAAQWQRTQPKDANFIAYMGSKAIASNDLTGALQHFEKVAVLQPNNAVVLNNLAWIKGRLGRDDALADAEHANVLVPNQPAFMDTWAMLLSDAQQHEKAIELQKKVLQRQQQLPAQPQAQQQSQQQQMLLFKLHLAKIYIKAGQKDAARPLLTELASPGVKFSEQAEVAQLQQSL